MSADPLLGPGERAEARRQEIYRRLEGAEQGFTRLDERVRGVSERLDRQDRTAADARREDQETHRRDKAEILAAVEAGKVNVWKAIGISLPFVGAILLDVLLK